MGDAACAPPDRPACAGCDCRAGPSNRRTAGVMLAASRFRAWSLAAAVFVVTDFGTAQVLKRVYLPWYPHKAAKAREKENAAIEREYRVPSNVYHHDLAKQRAVTGAWGNVRYPVRTNSLGFR